MHFCIKANTEWKDVLTLPDPSWIWHLVFHKLKNI